MQSFHDNHLRHSEGGMQLSQGCDVKYCYVQERAKITWLQQSSFECVIFLVSMYFLLDGVLDMYKCNLCTIFSKLKWTSRVSTFLQILNTCASAYACLDKDSKVSALCCPMFWTSAKRSLGWNGHDRNMQEHRRFAWCFSNVQVMNGWSTLWCLQTYVIIVKNYSIRQDKWQVLFVLNTCQKYFSRTYVYLLAQVCAQHHSAWRFVWFQNVKIAKICVQINSCKINFLTATVSFCAQVCWESNRSECLVVSKQTTSFRSSCTVCYRMDKLSWRYFKTQPECFHIYVYIYIYTTFHIYMKCCEQKKEMIVFFSRTPGMWWR